MTTPIIRVFLCDDHPVVREGLRSLLNSQPNIRVVGEAADGEAALAALSKCEADVAVLDLSMPRMGGGPLTSRLAKEFPRLRVIALTVHEDRGYMIQMLQAGAKGYMLKRTAADELVRAVQTVAAGTEYVDPSLSKHLVQGLAKPAESWDAAKQVLSDRELEIAKRIALGYSTKEIAAHFDVSVKTIETHKSRLMGKLGFQSRVQLIRFAIEQGWFQPE